MPYSWAMSRARYAARTWSSSPWYVLNARSLSSIPRGACPAKKAACEKDSRSAPARERSRSACENRSKASRQAWPAMAARPASNGSADVDPAVGADSVIAVIVTPAGAMPPPRRLTRPGEPRLPRRRREPRLGGEFVAGFADLDRVVDRVLAPLEPA